MKRTATAPRARGEGRINLTAMVEKLDEARSLAAYLLPGWKYQCDRYGRAREWEVELRERLAWLNGYSDEELGQLWRDRAGEEGESE